MSTRLWRLLSSKLPGDAEVAEICSDVALHTEARAKAHMLASVARGAGEDGVAKALAPLVLVYGVGKAAETKAFWGVYFNALRDIPAEALSRAVDEYTTLPDSEFFPKPGPLKAIALKHAEPILKAAHRSRKAAESQLRKPIKRINGDELLELSALLRGAVKTINATPRRGN